MRIVSANHGALPFASLSPPEGEVLAALRLQEEAGLDVITDDLVRLVEHLLTRYAHDLVWLQPARGMRALDRVTAAAKLTALSRAAQELQGINGIRGGVALVSRAIADAAGRAGSTRSSESDSGPH